MNVFEPFDSGVVVVEVECVFLGQLGVTRRTSRNQLNSNIFFFWNTPHFGQDDKRARRQEKLWIEKKNEMKT